VLLALVVLGLVS